MTDANDAQLKVYLYIVRMMSANLATSVSDIADRFNYTEKDVLRALKYWKGKGILDLVDVGLKGIQTSLQGNGGSCFPLTLIFVMRIVIGLKRICTLWRGRCKRLRNRV